MPNFVTRRVEGAAPDTPEALFSLLRPPDPSVRHLWSHQADMLRAYRRDAHDAQNVAIELPTGSGKTLVGMLVADWRRRAKHERVAYLCPTKQLAHQVGKRARGYGIPTVVLVGRADDWPAGDHIKYERSEAVVITTYSTLFNTSPRIDDADVLLFDDAHAAEGYVADMWSLKAAREDALFGAVVDAIRPELPRAFAERLVGDAAGRDPAAVELLGPHQLEPHADLIREAIDVHASGNAAYAGRTIRNAVGRCLMYLSHRELLIRPLIAPTWFHQPFRDARQRVFMSATLGPGGELERSFGVPAIDRLPIPTGWQEYGAGRRYFMLPGVSLDDDVADGVTDAAIARAGRALVITQSDHELGYFRARLPAGTKEITAADLEADPDVITKAANAVALLANRYDGIDLPDDACRLIVLAGLPSATHLQERFLYERLGAKSVLAERIRTRIVQGAGRCTRNAKDFAAVILRGPSLLAFVSRQENARPMRPDLQAELDFGFDNANVGAADFLAFLDAFLEQDQQWLDADAEIRDRTQSITQEAQPGSAELNAAVSYEVRSWQAAWQDDLVEASELARRAAERLTGTAVGPYRSFWLFLAASWATARAGDNSTAVRHAEALVRDAQDSARSLPWRPRFGGRDEPREYPVEAGARDEAARQVLLDLGLRGLKFENRVAEVAELLADRTSTRFERGVRALGELLGFESVHPGTTAAPDGGWRDGEKAWFVFEAKTEVAATTPVSARDVRQALTHPAWLENYGWTRSETTFIANIIVGPQSAVQAEAAGLAGSTVLVSQDALMDIGDATFSALRRVRARAPGLSDPELAATIHRAFEEDGLDTAKLSLRLTERPIARMRQVG